MVYTRILQSNENEQTTPMRNTDESHNHSVKPRSRTQDSTYYVISLI